MHLGENKLNRKIPNYLKNKKCIDCGKQLSNYYAKRCQKHAAIESLKTRKIVHLIGSKNGMFGKKRPDLILFNKKINKKGKNNGNYKHGNTLIKQKCKICGKRISDWRRKFCKECWYRIHKHRKNMINKHHIDLNTKNNNKDNLLCLTGSLHQSLHRLVYHYLLEKFGIEEMKNYIKWFAKKKGIKL